MASKVAKALGVLTTYLFIIGFGIGSWVAVNGLWAELPILTESSPDGASLQPVLNVSIQVANVGPAIYLLLDLIIFKILKKKNIKPESFLNLTICLLIAIGIISSICLSIWYDSTAVIGGRNHSIALIVLAFMLALVDCTSTVTFIPFMKSFSSVKFMTALYVGEGLSGVLPSVFALAQGIGVSSSTPFNNSSSNGSFQNSTSTGFTPNYSPQVYFLLLAAMMAFCGFSFGMIQVLPWVQRSKDISLKEKGEEGAVLTSPRSESVPSDEGGGNMRDDVNTPLIFGPGDEPFSTKCFNVFCFDSCLSTLHLLVMQGCVNFLANGAINAVSFYAFRCYGPLTYLLALNLGLIANPIGAFVAVFAPVRSNVGVVILFVVSTALALVMLLFGFLGLTVHLPLLGSAGGSVIVVSCDCHVTMV